MNGEPRGLSCPGCGEHAAMLFTVGGQAFCGNPDCLILMWDTSKTLEELAEDVAYIDLMPILKEAEERWESSS